MIRDSAARMAPKKKLENIYVLLLDYVINDGIWRYTVPQEGSVPSLEEYTKLSPEVSSSLPLWLPSVPHQPGPPAWHSTTEPTMD